jgi:ligand-binding SRPBCC domain-containing protein
MKSWQHRHEWRAVNPNTTMMSERIEYEHHTGFRGLLTRLLFARPLLKIMFFYRAWATRRAVKNQAE